MEREYIVSGYASYEALVAQTSITLAPKGTNHNMDKTVEGGEKDATTITLSSANYSPRFRKVIRPTIVDNHDGSERRVKVTIVAQRRHAKSKVWQEQSSFTLPKLLAGEEVTMHLDSAETYELYQALRDLYAISRQGEPIPGTRHAITGNRRVSRVEREVSTQTGAAVDVVVEESSASATASWQELVDAGIDIPAAIAMIHLNKIRTNAVVEFEQHMNSGDWSEKQWQKFFYDNDWIFGYGLSYQFLNTVVKEAHVGGETVSGRGGQVSDFLMNTQATSKFTVLVEIKKPETKLLERDRYRNGAFVVSHELAGGVDQLQANCNVWSVEGSQKPGNRRDLDSKGISTYEPKGILVIGCLATLDSEHKNRSFELFRRNLKNPEVITFDELLARAKFMVEHENKKTSVESSDNNA